jgi:hypothetical protein
MARSITWATASVGLVMAVLAPLKDAAG